jgi:hypothetical protein
MKSPVFSALWFSGALWFLLFSLSVREWFWIAILVVLTLYGIVNLVGAVRTSDKQYRSAVIAACCSTFASQWCFALALTDSGRSLWWVMAINIGLGLLNGGLVIRHVMLMSETRALNLRIQRWKALYFTPEELELYEQAAGAK